MKVGFTGTRASALVLPERIDKLDAVLTEHYAEGSEFHHGDCLGMDSLALVHAHDIGYRTFAHPSVLIHQRAFALSDVMLRPAPPLVRNRTIVAICDVLIAVPIRPDHEERRSGTWMTIRTARKAGVPVVIV